MKTRAIIVGKRVYPIWNFNAPIFEKKTIKLDPTDSLSVLNAEIVVRIMNVNDMELVSSHEDLFKFFKSKYEIDEKGVVKPDIFTFKFRYVKDKVIYVGEGCSLKEVRSIDGGKTYSYLINADGVELSIPLTVAKDYNIKQAKAI